MPKKEPEKPKKTKRVYKKKTQGFELSGIPSFEKTTGLPAKQLGVIEDVIKSAFLRFHNAEEINNQKVKDLEHLDAITSEYLKTFMVLGYDLNGEKVVVMHATTPHDKDAIVEHLRTTLISIINAGQGN